jgi:hypothetical protein
MATARQATASPANNSKPKIINPPSGPHMAKDIEGTSRAYRLSGELEIRTRPTFLQARCRRRTLTFTAENPRPPARDAGRRRQLSGIPCPF